MTVSEATRTATDSTLDELRAAVTTSLYGAVGATRLLRHLGLGDVWIDDFIEDILGECRSVSVVDTGRQVAPFLDDVEEVVRRRP